MKGFTLIELLIVFAFIGILTALGIAAYTSYNSSQSVQSSASDVVTMLNTAKSRSLAQVIPTSCAANPVTGYQVDVTLGSQQYTLSAMCAGKQVVTANKMAPNVTFGSGSTTSIFFAISSGTLAAPATIKITGYGKIKTISVSQTGSVTAN